MSGAPLTLFVPRDAAALSVGADALAAALEREAALRGRELHLVRTGSRGLLWLEPLVELATERGRAGFGPLAPADVPGLFDADFGRAAAHPLALGLLAELPFFKRQERITFRRCGEIAPDSLEDYRRAGGLRGLERALSLGPAQVVQQVFDSGLRGRGGAGFPAGIKWRTVAEAPGPEKYICCNADEGDSGTYADRMLMEGDPLLLIEGMAIAALACGATRGFVYVRSEYPHAIRAMLRAIEAARAGGVIGPSVLGSHHAFELSVRRGAGAYICGEETAMLESLEGRRGTVRPKPPLPALEGLFGKPTLIHNVLTLAAVPTVLAEGAAYYRDFGVGRSRGTQPFQLAGNVARGGLVEKAFGVSLAELVHDFGGGTRSGRPVRAVQVGGPLGAYLPAHQLELAADYETLAAAGAMLGHGGVVVFDDSVDMALQARFSMQFCAIESCGKCTPCRIGAVRGTEVIDRIRAGLDVERNTALLEDLCEVMTDGSLCAMGGLTPLPVRSALRHFAEDFRKGPPGAARV